MLSFRTALYPALYVTFAFASCAQMEKALVSQAQNTEDKDGQRTKSVCSQNPTVPQTSDSAIAQVPPLLKGVSQSLLDRVGIVSIVNLG